MGKLRLFVAITLTLYSSVNANAQSNPFSRSLKQQLFIIKHFGQVKINITSVEAVDSLYKTISNKWRGFVIDSLSNTELTNDVLNNIDTYASFMALKHATGKMKNTDALEFHVFKNYMLPNMTYDFDAVKSDPSSANLALLTMPSLVNFVILGSNIYSVDRETFMKFYSVYKDVLNFLVSFNTTDKSIAQNLQRISLRMKDYQYAIQSQYHLLHGDSDAALSNFVTGLSINKLLTFNAVPLGKDLKEYFASTHEKDKGIAVLNNMMIYTSSDQISRDTLYRWYVTLDSISGPKMYTIIDQKLNGNKFKTGSKTSIRIPEKWNFIANNPADQKLKSTKYYIVDIWHTACAPCIAEIPELNKLSLGTQGKDVTFLSINADFSNTKRPPKTVLEFIQKHKISFPVVYDDAASKFIDQLQVNGYPTKVIFDHNGRLITKVGDSQITIPTLLEFIKQSN